MFWVQKIIIFIFCVFKVLQCSPHLKFQLLLWTCLHLSLGRSNFPILGCSVCLIENSEDPDQTPHYEVSDLGLHCCLSPIKRTPGLNGLKSRVPKIKTDFSCFQTLNWCVNHANKC